MEDKKVLITGAGSGLGRALSRWLSNLSANLCLLSQSQQKLDSLQAELKHPSKTYALDFTSAEAVDRVLSDLITKHFIPDIIIHCAGGGFKMRNPLLEREEFHHVLDVNLMTAIQINHHFVPKMQTRRQGVIIHVASTAAHAAQGSVAYNTAKAALAAYVRSLGRALAASGIVVTGISPGGFIAEGNNMFHFKHNDPNQFASYAESLPSKRLADVEEFFSIIKLLCNQEGSLFSGCMLPVDAGEGLSYTN